jgi:hypothetical protein
MIDVEVRGNSRPTRLTSPLPWRLKDLLAKHGGGILAGQIRLVAPGSAEHAAIDARIRADLDRRVDLSWLQLRRTTTPWTAVGHVLCDLAWLIFDGEELALALRSGAYRPIARDLDGLLEQVQSPTLFNMLAKDAQLEVDWHDLERAIKKVQLSMVYELESTRPEDRLERAVAARDASAASAAFDAILATFSPPFAAVTLTVALASDEARALVGEQQIDAVATIARRHRVLHEIITARSSTSTTIDVQTLREIGLKGTTLPPDGLLAWPATVETIRTREVGIREIREALSEDDSAVFDGALAACSPFDLCVECRPEVADTASWLARAWPVAFVDVWSGVGMETTLKAWPKVGRMLGLTSDLIVVLLDRVLLQRIPERVARGHYGDVVTATSVAAIRVRAAPLTATEVERLLATARALAARSVEPANELAPARVYIGGVGLLELLATAARNQDVMAFFAELCKAQRFEESAASVFFEAITYGGDSTPARELLASIYNRPRVFEFDDRLTACETAATWGDERARDKLVKMKAQDDRRMRNL